jgi:hypothetical protein
VNFGCHEPHRLTPSQHSFAGTQLRQVGQRVRVGDGGLVGSVALGDQPSPEPEEVVLGDLVDDGLGGAPQLDAERLGLEVLQDLLEPSTSANERRRSSALTRAACCSTSPPLAWRAVSIVDQNWSRSMAISVCRCC